MKGSRRRGRVQESKCRSKEALGPGEAEAQEAGPRGVSSPRSGRDSGQCPPLSDPQHGFIQSSNSVTTDFVEENRPGSSCPQSS